MGDKANGAPTELPKQRSWLGSNPMFCELTFQARQEQTQCVIDLPNT